MFASLATHLICTVCGTKHELNAIQNTCRSCGKALETKYDLDKGKGIWKREDVQGRGDSFWKYLPFLPVQSPSSIVSIGERVTPMLRLPSLEGRLGVRAVWVKDEACLPTGSFKARGLALAITRAAELGVRHVCIPSAGNAAGACAAYAARAGMRCTIAVPDDTPVANIEESKVYGADVRLVKGTISDAAMHLLELRKEHADWFDVSTFKEPYRLEGKKTMGYEIAEQFEWNLPDVIIYPTGGGTGLVGMWKAFSEMEQLGWVGAKRPRMVTSQSAGCAPIVRAFGEGKTESTLWEGAVTKASGLRVPKPFADRLILNVLRDSGGAAVAASDAESQDAIAKTGREDGFYFCPEGGTTVVVLERLVKKGWIKGDETVLLWNTAAASKYSGVM